MRSLILSQWRDLRIGVTREDLGALTTVRARQSYVSFGPDLRLRLLFKLHEIWLIDYQENYENCCHVSCWDKVHQN